MRGRFIKNCEGTPASNLPIQIVFYEWDKKDYGTHKAFFGIVGAGTTGASGDFEIPCEYYGRKGALGLRVNGEMYRPEFVRIEDRQHDFGNMPMSGDYFIRIRVISDKTYLPTDTLFMAISSEPSQMAQLCPIQSGTLLTFSKPLRPELWFPEGPQSDVLRWGIGRKQFDETTYPNNSPVRRSPILMYPCDSSYVTEIEL